MKIKVTPNTEGHFIIKLNSEVLSNNIGMRKVRNYTNPHKSSDSKARYSINKEPDHLKQTYSVHALHLRVLKRGVTFAPVHTDVNAYKLTNAVQEAYLKEFGVECPWQDRHSNKDWQRLEMQFLEQAIEGRRDDLLEIIMGNGQSLFTGKIEVVINV